MPEYTYKSVRAVYTSWSEVYVYADGELVDTIDFTGMDQDYARTLVEEYALEAKVAKSYDLEEDYEEDGLPDEFRDIPRRFLIERDEDHRAADAMNWGVGDYGA
jgi:hypothetical protein